MVKRKDWDVVRDSEQWEVFRNLCAAKRARGEKLTPEERGRLGGLSTREKHGWSHYRDMARKARWG